MVLPPVSGRGSTPRQPLRPGKPAEKSVGALLLDADDAVGAAVGLCDQVDVQQADGQRKRLTLEREATESIASDVERLRRERDLLNAKLTELARHIHQLEVSGMDLKKALQERQRSAKAAVMQLQKLRKTDSFEDSGAQGTQGTQGAQGTQEVRELRDLSRQLEKSHQEIEGDLQELHRERDKTQRKLSDCLHALAIGEALFRARTQGALRPPGAGMAGVAGLAQGRSLLSQSLDTSCTAR